LGWNDPSYGLGIVKPLDPFQKRQFPQTDYFFHSGAGKWRGYPFFGGDDDSEPRKFHNFSREFLLESKRERAKEMFVFAIVVLASLWPVIYMVITVVKLLLKGRPLDN
jgi:hypothetical protein